MRQLPVMRKLIWMFLSATGPLLLPAQIHLVNPSFEGDEPQDATVPAGWHPCKPGTTPDVLPGVWGVFNEPSEGETFVGIITRADGSWESIGQRLPESVGPNECYAITVDLAHSKTYAGYNDPIKLRIWGGRIDKCEKFQLLAESPFVDHADWKTYSFQFVPKEPIHYIVLEAFYSDEHFSHQGNILIDNLRPIKVCIRADAGVEQLPERF
jgi:hypothetical protein